ncbi:MAG: hypothetical protein Q4B67_06130 [Eubacteriales bacterium]|nr:hypothetical protein [Eubacteriales bacterium]
MKVSELSSMFKLINAGDMEREVKGVFCCDLLSVAMGKAPADSAWVTVMANVNTLAVASLTDVSCVVLAEGAVLDEATVNKAREQEITVFSTEEPIFEAALRIHG